MEKLDKLSSFTHENSTDNINRLPYRWKGGMHVSQPHPSIVHKKTRIESFFEVSSSFVPAALIVPVSSLQRLLSAAHGKEEVLCQSADRLLRKQTVPFCAAQRLVHFWMCNAAEFSLLGKLSTDVAPQNIRVYKVLLPAPYPQCEASDVPKAAQEAASQTLRTHGGI